MGSLASEASLRWLVQPGSQFPCDRKRHNQNKVSNGSHRLLRQITHLANRPKAILYLNLNPNDPKPKLQIDRARGLCTNPRLLLHQQMRFQRLKNRLGRQKQWVLELRCHQFS